MKRLLLFALPLMLLVGCNTDTNDGENIQHYFAVWAIDGMKELCIVASFTDQEDINAVPGWHEVGVDRNWMAQRLSGNWSVGVEYDHLLNVNTTVGCMPSSIYKATYDNLFLVFDVLCNNLYLDGPLARCAYYGVWTNDDNIEAHPELHPELFAERMNNIYNHIIVSYPDNDRRTSYCYYFKYAGINQVRIKANKDLWGVKAGEDVSNKFRILEMQDLMLSYPDFEIAKKCGEMPAEKLSELTGLMLKQCPICIKMTDVPSEVYDNITFTIEVEVQLPDDKTQTVSNSVTVEFDN